MQVYLKKRNYSSSAVFVIALLLVSHILIAQSSLGDENFKVNIIPPSPEAASLAKYSDIPISLYSGIPEISIPLYEIRERGIAVPITLNYHASGNKVETIAPRTGLGWSLLAHGSISRTMRSRPDEYCSQGFLKQSQLRPITEYSTASDEQRWQWFADMADGCMDIEPDQFYFNFGSYSGTFTFDWTGTGTITIASGSKIKLIPIGLNIGACDYIRQWQATGEDGTIYTFDVTEMTDVIEYGGSSPGCTASLQERQIPQTWYLSKIETANKESWIRFEYEEYSTHIASLASESENRNAELGAAELKRSYIKTHSGVKQLKRITTSSGQTSVDFLNGEVRADMASVAGVNTPPGNGGFTLSEIQVKNSRGRIVKDWKFGYDYSIGRLTLKTLTECAGAQSKPPYSFTYNGSIGERRLLAFNQDRWGFPNENSAQLLVPAVWTPRLGSNEMTYLEGANREPSSDEVLKGMLTTISYPTGGKDIMVFEPHDYSYENAVKVLQDLTSPQAFSGNAPRLDLSPPLTPGQWDINNTVFDLPLGAKDVELNATFSFELNFAGGQHRPEIKLTNLTTGEIVYSVTESGAGTLNDDGSITPEIKYVTKRFINGLTAGTYQLQFKGRRTQAGLQGLNSVDGTLSLKKLTGQQFTPILQGGGVRIASLRRSFGNGNPDQVTYYKYRIAENDQEISSGSLAEVGRIYAQLTSYVERIGETGSFVRQRFSRVAQSMVPLGTTKGSHVGYSLVSVLHGDNGKYGKTIYKFSTASDYTSLEIPYPPSQSYDYARGLEKEICDLDVHGNLVRKIENEYAFYDEEIPAIKMGWALPGSLLGPQHMDAFARGDYTNILGYSRLIQTKETNFFPDQPEVSPLVVTKKFTYDELGHKQLFKTITYDSDGDSTFTQVVYPGDANAMALPVINEMRLRNMHNQALEMFTWRYNTLGQRLLLSGVSTSFISNNGKIVPASMLRAKVGMPTVTADPLGLARQLYEGRLNYSSYNYTYVNLIEHSLKNGMFTSYIWGENGTLIIAKAEHAQAKQIHHTSFEEDVAGISISDQKTGRNSKVINGVYTIPTATRPAFNGDYLLSWWEKTGNTPWVFKEKLIPNYVVGTAISTDTVNGLIDEIRLYPVGANMTTFTHEPLVGVTSITDTNNVTVYFEYDEFNRLKCKRDQDHNILEWFDYQFQQQPVFSVH